MNATPLFSIVMPCYNQQAYLAQAVACVRAQTWDDWELILVDDASTDATLQLATQLAETDERICVITHPENRGLSAARNSGLAKARGTYVWMPDPDDTYDANLLRAVAQSLAENPANVVIFGAREEYFDAEGVLYSTRSIDAAATVGTSAPHAIFTTPQTWRTHVLPLEEATLLGYAWNKVYDLPFLRAHDLQFEDVPLIEDITFNVGVLQHAQSINVLAGTPYAYAKRTARNLTAAYVPEYWPVHLQRVQMLRDMLAEWNILDDNARAHLGARLARYMLSAAQRVHDPRATMDAHSRRAWAKAALEEPLCQELLPAARSHNPKLAALLPALRHGNTSALLAAGYAINKVKTISNHAYARIKK